MTINGHILHQWMRDLYPICRSITGDGVRQTLNYFKEIVPDLTLHEIPSGTNCYDWTVPDEWNIDEAYLIGPDGDRIVDFKDHSLHVLNYSVPVDTTLSLDELQPHLYSREDLPEAIPYVTSYYEKRWGFCLPHAQRKTLKPGTYRAVIKSRLEPGSLTYGELFLPGRRAEEILVTSYTCHPSMCNNELSGPVTLVGLAAWLAEKKDREFSYRFYLGPETIGSICYIHRHLERLRERCVGGLLLTCCGDAGNFSMVHSKKGDTHMDFLAETILREHTKNHRAYSFLDRESDEQQFNSPGIDLPFISFEKTLYRQFPEYHTSLDDLNFVTTDTLGSTFEVMQHFFSALEANQHYQTTTTCIPQLGKRGLYPTLSDIHSGETVEPMLDFLTYADGTLDLAHLAQAIGISFAHAKRLATIFLEHELIKPVFPDTSPWTKPALADSSAASRHQLSSAR
ncbi:DUF4910 domain-containing protein [Pseudodesulfovibrio sp. JC047]|uniref:DUF4910 domain-containing protein n=1 Tax=Pseudodesulfovibrio sp. JC047 TaxID=2683199 RepID=UPI0013D60850|nr:DUF4910 domain-containing protein [Pseudodesulfovibrio sp. JC047]NDV20637.1 DUF4910 domain-containing protein [Pseudodesulfovibrio sp. JC047]